MGTLQAQQDCHSSKPRKGELYKDLLRVSGGSLHQEGGPGVHIHTHTRCWPWLVLLHSSRQRAGNFFYSLPTLLRGEQRVCVKETLLSKVIYEDRFFCIRDQSSESRDQLRHPSAAQGGKKHPPKPTKKTLSSFERGCEKQEGGEHSKSKSASKKSSRIRSFPV